MRDLSIARLPIVTLGCVTPVTQISFSSRALCYVWFSDKIQGFILTLSALQDLLFAGQVAPFSMDLQGDG